MHFCVLPVICPVVVSSSSISIPLLVSAPINSSFLMSFKILFQTYSDYDYDFYSACFHHCYRGLFLSGANLRSTITAGWSYQYLSCFFATFSLSRFSISVDASTFLALMLLLFLSSFTSQFTLLNHR